MKYIIASITSQNNKHNFYHDEMRGSIATIVSMEIGDGAVIRYTPEYDNCPHHVTTTTVKSINETNTAIVIETNNTVYVFQAIEEAEFITVWDGGLTVTTGCKVNMATKEVFDIEVFTVSADGLDIPEERYVTIGDEKFPVYDGETDDGYWYRG